MVVFKSTVDEGYLFSLFAGRGLSTADDLVEKDDCC